MKKKEYRNRDQNGFLMIEIIVSLALLSLLLSAFAVSLNGFRKTNDFYMSRQRCLSAAQAQLDSIAVVGKAIDESIMEQLWPDITVETRKTAGSGDWEGLTLVSATAVTKVDKRNIEITLKRYIRLEEL